MAMPQRNLFTRGSGQFDSFGRCFTGFKTLLLISASAFVAASANAQAPALLWTTNVGAMVFAIDSQTNVYASAANVVMKISPAGEVLQSISVTNRLGLAQRDSAGNLYHAGTYAGSFNGSGYDYGTSFSCFLTTYNSAG